VKPERAGEPDADGGLAGYPLLDALRGRRSRRFGMGMKIPDGPFAYESRHEPLPLTEAEEAALAFAACGVTGYALAALSYGRFPAYAAPFRTVLGYQATHVDEDFYDLFYRPEALSETQRRHADH
jgi:hypothetical protein